MASFNEELVRAGVMLAGEGLHPSSKGVRINYSGVDAYRSASDVVAAPEDKMLLEALATLRSGHWSGADSPGSFERTQRGNPFLSNRLPDDLREVWISLRGPSK